VVDVRDGRQFRGTARLGASRPEAPCRRAVCPPPARFCGARALRYTRAHEPRTPDQEVCEPSPVRRLAESAHHPRRHPRAYRQGEKLRVVEDKTGNDITRHILLQVIAEQEQAGRPILSTKVLEAIIRFYGNSLQGYLASFLERSIEMFLKQQEAVQSQISRIVANTPLAAVADITRQNLEALAKVQESMLNVLLPKRDKDRDEDDKRS
jgi:polyhydroxyalkanoate synthesis repressor PhaR